MIPNYTLECSICGDRGDGPHFGALSCRACAAFFRRAVSQKLHPFCKTGTNNCRIDKSVTPRFWCGKCRYQKCIRQGMNPSNVQAKRDRICKESSTKKTTSSGPVQLHQTGPADQFSLQNFTSNYKFLCKSRRTRESQLPNKHNNRLIGSGKMKGCRLASMIEINQAFQVGVPCVSEFVNSSFPEFSGLSLEEKTILMEPFLVLMFGMDNSYRTYKRVKKEHYVTISVMAETFYYDNREMDAFLADCPNNSTQRTDLSRALRFNIGFKKRRIIDIMSQMEISEEEYVAVLGLILWSAKIDVSTPKIDFLGRNYRNEIFQQLHEFYTEKNSMNNYAQRLGELMTLQTVVLQEIIGFREDLELFSLFDAFEKELFFYKLIRNTRL